MASREELLESVHLTRFRRQMSQKGKMTPRAIYEMGEALERIAAIPDEGDPLFKVWGYSSFAEYVQHEAKFSYRTAMFWRSIYRLLAHDLKGLSSYDKDRILRLGIAKLRRLTTVMHRNNWKEWVEYAETVGSIALGDAIKRLNSGGEYRIDPLAPGAEDYGDKPPVEARTPKTFLVSHRQDAILRAAMRRVASDAASNDMGDAMAQICLAYLKTHANEHVPVDVLVRLIREQGFEVVVLDPSTTPHTLVMGVRALNDFTHSLRENMEGRDD